MVIEPGNLSKNGIQGPGASSNRTKAEAPARPEPTQHSEARPSDSVSFSQQAQSMRQLESRVMQSENVDMAKVDAIRQSIAEGRYMIDSQSIAGRILAQDADFS